MPATDAKPDFATHFREGLAHFNNREFWEAHESWETLWLVAESDVEQFLQGLIQIAAAYHQELSGVQIGLVGNWKFDEGRGTLAVDSAGPPQNATLIGEASWLTTIPQF